MLGGLQHSVGNTSLTSLMMLYEENYVLIRRLAPNLRTSALGVQLSHRPSGMDLYLSIIEQSKYTTTCHLSYRFDSDAGIRYAPDITVRIYHDARNAEVMSGLLHGQRHVLRAARSLGNSWRINRFLYKWLRFCLYQGHRFHEYEPSWR